MPCTHVFWVHPSQFSGTIVEDIKARLPREVKGTCSALGYIIDVIKIDNVSGGRVPPGLGSARFEVTYQALVCRVFREEVVDAPVTEVMPVGFFAYIGPVKVFISEQNIPSDLKFNANINPPRFSSEEDPAIIARGNSDGCPPSNIQL
ncbi:hypothetical protein PTTG_28119 [Puccinia triticina 1-1 BBBD Race 1]|uniref:S1 motif domain-containing protein n=1 Tax=Puccinia triticina (isolate 1-1 / race 1 (BBBD)) TaxID=630390 RepID=A0A0C4EVS5_PUCT1|nr:hypothetical protein PTTG_28119 [Puccinia triticina 1-1 BBBD Race 1]